MKYKFIIITLITLFIFSSCRSSDSEYAFKCAIEGNPKTLDPQCASSDSSVQVFSFILQGLFAFGDNGEIIEGMIDDYTVSDDGTVWTFNLKSDVYWSDGDEFSAECTAADYLFAFERLFRPATKSERASEYYIIKNSEAINKGEISDMSLLGVNAVDRYTLEITLEEPCSDLRALLSLPPAMPCNEEFFLSTQGRYGLAADCIASNSGYYVHTWSYDKWSNENNYFILRRNKHNPYQENSPYSINLFINPVNSRKDFDEEVLNVYRGINSEEIYELKKSFDYSEYETAVWGIIFNLKSKFSNQNYRLELSNAVDFTSSDEQYNGFYGIIPYSVSLDGKAYREHSGELSNIICDYDNVGALSGMKMIMPSGTGLRGDIGRVMQGWQSECGFYCSLSELETDEYRKALEQGDFDIALVKLSGEYNSPYAYLNDFLEGNSTNFSGYNSKKYSHIINSALTANDSLSAAIYYKEAEQLLIDSGVFIPLCTETEYVFYEEKLEGMDYNPFSGIYSVKK